MATTTKALARAAFATSSATLYTVPSSTTAVVTSIAVCNTSTSTQTFNILLDGVALFDTASIAADTTVSVDLKQVLATTKVIAGFASATSVTVHISGVEIA
jgi:hypothetical protein